LFCLAADDYRLGCECLLAYTVILNYLLKLSSSLTLYFRRD
jgi:hypothetical protein